MFIHFGKFVLSFEKYLFIVRMGYPSWSWKMTFQPLSEEEEMSWEQARSWEKLTFKKNSGYKSDHGTNRQAHFLQKFRNQM